MYNYKKIFDFIMVINLIHKNKLPIIIRFVLTKEKKIFKNFYNKKVKDAQNQFSRGPSKIIFKLQ